MSKINYIQHQIAFFRKVYEDDRLSPFHISLYMALFQYWNINRFQTTFGASRSELMQLSKVKSKSTYSKCLNELHKWNYIAYAPSNNPFVKSTFDLSIKWTTLSQPDEKTSSSNGPPIAQPSPINGLLSVPEKRDKHKPLNSKKKPSSEIEVIDFFEKNQSSNIEGQKFWNHYESKGWMVGNTSMIDWQAAARKWIIILKEKTKPGLVQQMDYLQTTSNKDYNEPL